MRQLYILLFLLLLPYSSFSQHNMLDKPMDFILGFYRYDPEFTVDVDTLSETKALITCKSVYFYPYYTYEINLIEDRCVSYGFASKDRIVMETYIELLGYLGTIVKTDNSFTEFVYEVVLKNKKVYYTIKQPYANSNVKTRKDIFYVLVSEVKTTEKGKFN